MATRLTQYARCIANTPCHQSHLVHFTHAVTYPCDKEETESEVNGGIPPVCCQLKVKAVFIQPFQFTNLVPSDIAEEVVN